MEILDLKGSKNLVGDMICPPAVVENTGHQEVGPPAQKLPVGLEEVEVHGPGRRSCYVNSELPIKSDTLYINLQSLEAVVFHRRWNHEVRLTP